MKRWMKCYLRSMKCERCEERECCPTFLTEDNPSICEEYKWEGKEVKESE
jgi:hypothetical protein